MTTTTTTTSNINTEATPPAPDGLLDQAHQSLTNSPFTGCARQSFLWGIGTAAAMGMYVLIVSMIYCIVLLSNDKLNKTCTDDPDNFTSSVK